MEIRMPMGNSVWGMMIRQRPYADDKKYSSYKRTGRNKFLVVRPHEHAHDVGNDESDKTDHPRRVNSEPYDE